MTDREFERRLRAWYATAVGPDGAPYTLTDRVAAVPEQSNPAAGWFRGGRRGWAVALLMILLAAALLGGAIAVGSRLIPVPSVFERVPPHPASFDVCGLLGDVDVAGAGGSHRFSQGGHDVLASADTCVLGWDDRFSRPHLIFRTEPTAASDAAAMLDRALAEDGVAWREVESGVWAGSGTEGDGRGSFGAAAVAWEPYFFLITAPTDDEAVERARHILDVLEAAAGGG